MNPAASPHVFVRLNEADCIDTARAILQSLGLCQCCYGEAMLTLVYCWVFDDPWAEA